MSAITIEEDKDTVINNLSAKDLVLVTSMHELDAAPKKNTSLRLNSHLQRQLKLIAVLFEKSESDLIHEALTLLLQKYGALVLTDQD